MTEGDTPGGWYEMVPVVGEGGSLVGVFGVYRIRPDPRWVAVGGMAQTIRSPGDESGPKTFLSRMVDQAIEGAVKARETGEALEKDVIHVRTSPSHAGGGSQSFHPQQMTPSP
jgi:hypothetical protein